MLELYVSLLCYMLVNAKEPELPLCPANVQYLPQNLPMHCRMPIKVEPKNQPFQFPPGFQVMPGMQSLTGVPMPAALPRLPAPQPMMTALQPPQQLPPPMQPMQLMPGIPGLPAPMMPQKLPVVVMPYYSPVSSKKDSERKHSRKDKTRHKYVSDETSDVDSNGSKSDEDEKYYRARRHHRQKRRKLKIKQQMLTPLLQYVTKDGYVIYEKKISNGEAKKWLNNDGVKERHNKEAEFQEDLKQIRNFIFNEKDKQKNMLAARRMSKSTRKN